ncbi:unnamed protein product [Brachionus calyciflorus]|uniref:Uncharacterized protein n=1 Tax=Brachionus calyciflorus TaxID=104777 RepID=A0A814RK37_9BILA|nr:unnamed protein product [Brachionus calyciflorus]
MKYKHISLVVLVVIIYGLDALSTDQNVILKAKRQMCVGGGSCSSDRANNYNYNWGKRDVGVVTKNETKNDLPIVKRQMCVGGGSCSSDRANNYNYNYGKRDVAEVATNEIDGSLKVKRHSPYVMQQLANKQNSKRSVNKRQMCVGGGSCSSDRANNYNYNWGKRDVVTKNETQNVLPIVKRQMCIGGATCQSTNSVNITVTGSQPIPILPDRNNYYFNNQLVSKDKLNSTFNFPQANSQGADNRNNYYFG